MKPKWPNQSRDEVRAAQARALRRYLRDEVMPYSQVYRERFAQSGFDPNRLRSLDDLRRLPFTTKQDLLNSPDHPRRSLDFLIRPSEEQLKRRPAVIAGALLRGRQRTLDAVQYEYRPVFMSSTTGRSSDPVLFLYTRHDLDRLSRAGERLVDIFDARMEDRVLNLFPYAPHLAFWQVHYATTASGVFSIGTGGGKVMGTEGSIRIARKMQPSCIIGMPTFIYHVFSHALEEDIRLKGLRMVLLGGEKVPVGMRRKLAEMARQLGATEDVSVMATYGFTEARMAWGECPFPVGDTPSGYHLYPDMEIVEVVDPETGEAQPEGQPGEIVYTPLDARGTVVIRYRTGDCIDGGLVYEPCPRCGRRTPRLFGNISRRSDVREIQVDKIKGTMVDFNAPENLLDNTEHIGAWQLELRKVNDDPLEVDELILHVEKRNGAAEDVLRSTLSERLQEATELRPNEIHFHTASSLRKRQGVGVELKEKRVVDHRPDAEGKAPARVTDEGHRRARRFGAWKFWLL